MTTTENHPKKRPAEDQPEEDYAGGSASEGENEEENVSGTPTSGGQNKRIRVNHNEIERKRRNAQKARLDDLRRSIPALVTQDKASMVSIIIRAKEYIDQLKLRIYELEGMLGGSVARTMPSHPSSVGLPGQVIAPKPASGTPHYTPIAPQPRPVQAAESPMQHSKIQQIQAHQMLIQQQQQQQAQMLNQALLLAEAASRIPINVGAPSGPAPLLPHQMLSVPGAVQPEEKRISTSSGSDFDMQTFLQDRKSSLILPTDDNVFLGKRDSIQNFFTTGMPSILEESLQSDIKCCKCQRGINSLIMIDCDKCHSWYHIRCVGIDSTNIPLTWTCTECSYH